jgi:hypothetical protein
MKGTRVLVAFLGIMAFTQLGWAQGTPVYDRSYSGPMNVYGQPTFTPPPTQQRQADQDPYPMNGPLPMAARGVQSMGSYLWSYMPAPVRGVQSPYNLSPDSGKVNVNFVPGATR